MRVTPSACVYTHTGTHARAGSNGLNEGDLGRKAYDDSSPTVLSALAFSDGRLY